MVSRDVLARIDPELLGVIGLGLVALLAGITKFTHPAFWQGYEPAVIRSALTDLGLDPLQVFGVLEAGLGLALVAGRRWYITVAAFLWLLAITVQVASLGLWDIAIRDLGLTFYAATVTLYQYQRK